MTAWPKWGFRDQRLDCLTAYQELVQQARVRRQSGSTAVREVRASRPV